MFMQLALIELLLRFVVGSGYCYYEILSDWGQLEVMIMLKMGKEEVKMGIELVKRG